MSFELHFRNPGKNIGFDQIRDFFATRQHYLDLGDEFYYEHPETGTTFRFELNDSSYPVTFRMSYNRSESYMTEADSEISSLVERFGFLVYDPQSEFSDDRNLDNTLVAESWKNGNDFAQTIASESGGHPQSKQMEPPGETQSWLKIIRRYLQNIFCRRTRSE
jgi:hypothetical protein